jgi:hypothetical protein
MTNRKRIVFALFITIFILFSTIGNAQKAKEISLSVYPGFTLVNFEKALGYSDEYMMDWDEFHIAVALRGFLSSEKPIQFGAELAWQQLYYAYYRVPYGPSPAERWFNVTTISAMALGRYSSKNFFLVGGGGIHFFRSGVAPAICLETGYMINGGSNLKFPVSFRINPIFGDGTPVPLSVGIGVSYVIK